MLVKDKGGLTYSVDKDPAVVELGNYKKLPTIQGSLEKLSRNDFNLKFDGVFFSVQLILLGFLTKGSKKNSWMSYFHQ